MSLLDRKINGVKSSFPELPLNASGHELKAFEDKLDAVVCCWAGICALNGQAIAYGDQESAIWIPSGGHEHRQQTIAAISSA